MTTHTIDTPVNHTTDAEFRTWINEFETLLTTVGLVVHTDTGQLTLASATRPTSANTYAGFRIYRFNDALQATAPIYIRVDFGSGAFTTTPAIKVQVGSNTNGAGTLTGVVSSVFTSFSNSVLTNPGITNRLSLAAHGAGYAWIVFKHGMLTGSGAGFGFVVTRTADGAGDPTALGFQVYGMIANTDSSGRAQYMLYTGSVGTQQVPSCLIPGGFTSSVVGTDLQFWKHYVATPRVRCNPYVLTSNTADSPFNVSRSLAVVGSTPRTYIFVGISIGSTMAINGAIGNGLMLIWE